MVNRTNMVYSVKLRTVCAVCLACGSKIPAILHHLPESLDQTLPTQGVVLLATEEAGLCEKLQHLVSVNRAEI